MFRRNDTQTSTEPPADQPAPNPAEDLVPLSVLALDVEPPAAGGWHAYLTELGVRVQRDYVGRDSIAAIDAMWLLSQQRDAEDRQREATERNDAAIEARRLAQLHPGIPADQVPDGLSPAMAMVSAGGPPEWAEQHRESVLEHALRREEGYVFHPIGPDSDAA